MKISIWQQFSSNHSNTFTVVGEFATEADAARAADELCEIFGHIAEQSERTKYDDVLVPAEKYYAEVYDIKWDRHLDWVYNHPTHYVIHLDKTVFVSPMDSETWLGAYVVDELVAKLGAKVEKYDEMNATPLLVKVTAQCPDPETASRLHSQIMVYLEANNKYWQNPSARYMERPAAPWVFHYLNKPDVSNQTIEAALKHRIEFWSKMDDIRAEIRQLKMDGDSASEARIEALQQEHDGLITPYLASEEAKLADWFQEAMRDTEPFEEDEEEEKLQRATLNDNTLVIENLWFFTSLGSALFALVNWLRGEGCQVEYSIESREVNG